MEQPKIAQAELLERAITETLDGRPRLFVESFLSIRDEQERIVPLKYNQVQAHYDANHSNRDIKLKPRKIGFSTQSMAEMFAFATCTPNFEGLALTYDDEETHYLFEMIDRFDVTAPKHARGNVKSKTTTSIEFDFKHLGSSHIEVQTAGGGRKGRGRTPSYVLVDELALYDERQQDAIWSSVVNSVPLTSRLVIQSTPKGIGNKFHVEFVHALDGKGSWHPHFYPWMWLPDKHALPQGSNNALPADRGTLMYSQEEAALIARWNATSPQSPIGEDNIRWRRLRLDIDKDTFAQEFPEDAVSCFLATSRTVFSTQELNVLVPRHREPATTRQNGALKIWRRPDSGQHYVVAVDCANGVAGGDNACAIVGTDDGRVDAVFAAPVGQAEMAQIVYALAVEYNGAFIINERQNAYEFQRIVVNDLGYNYIYRHKDTMGFKPDKDLPVGFPTTGGASGNKMRLVETMRRALESDGLHCPDLETLRELIEYQVHKDGTYGAPSGRHDDRAMAAMLYLVGVQSQPIRAGRSAVSQHRIASFYPDEVFA